MVKQFDLNDRGSITALAAVERIDKWLDQNGWEGWDPYDIQASVLFQKIECIQPLLIKKILKILVGEAVQWFPFLARRLFHVQPAINAKGMGLFLASYANLYAAGKDRKHLDKAVECAEWLLQNKNNQFAGISWGYPFDWRSPIFLPKGTPSSVVTSIIGDGFFRLYRCTKDDVYLEVCKEICEFFLQELNITYSSPERSSVCYSYTPLDNYQVHNANLFVGEFLVRIGTEIDNSNLVEKGLKSGNFALGEQQEEGFLPYWGLEQTSKYSNGKLHTDHYHSGFEIRMLYQIWKHTADDRFEKAYKRYLDWYIVNMFQDDVIPKFTPNSLYPINIHSCAEAILCHATLLKDHPNFKSKIAQIMEQVIRTMEYEPGAYTHVIKKRADIFLMHSNIPMIRWGQAWMMCALSEILISDSRRA